MHDNKDSLLHVSWNA